MNKDDEVVSAQLWLLHSNNHWEPIESCQFNVTLPTSGYVPTELTKNGTACSFSLPEESRIRWSSNDTLFGGPLLAKFRFLPVKEDGYGPLLAESRFMLTRIAERTSFGGGGLWQSNSGSADGSLVMSPSSVRTNHTFVPHFKYASQPVVIRYVHEDRPYGGPPPLYRSDGIPLRLWNRTTYLPNFYVDENALQYSLQREMAPPSESQIPPVTLRIQISTLSPIQDVLNQQLTQAISMAESMLSGSELDEIRYWLRDEKLYRFFLTQVISFIHMWLEYLAFRDEFRFYRGKTTFTGVSVSSVVSRLVCSIIIFLYLMDGGGTSWVVLASIFAGIVLDAWKVWRLLRPTVSLFPPFVTITPMQNEKERATAEYDRLAMKYVGFVLYPIVAGWSIYALYHYEYKSWYSWLVSNAANAVYTFGFIALCPQLYVNYRLKTVAHLPWKVFVYKIFTTFVDDFFAFLIDMPWKHRIMTLRDDVVFIMFLVQVYMYRVDKSRPNEFGYAYGDATKEMPAIASTEEIAGKTKQD
jgi:hypothetical protein